MDDVESEIKPNLENQFKVEKTLEKYPEILKPATFDKLSSFGEMLSFIIYDIVCHFGLFKNCPIAENRLRFLNEKKKHYLSTKN